MTRFPGNGIKTAGHLIPDIAVICMEEKSYTTEGVCSERIFFTIDGGRVSRVEFVGGCDGNLQGSRQPRRGDGGERGYQEAPRHRLQRQGDLLPRPARPGPRRRLRTDPQVRAQKYSLRILLAHGLSTERRWLRSSRPRGFDKPKKAKAKKATTLTPRGTSRRIRCTEHQRGLRQEHRGPGDTRRADLRHGALQPALRQMAEEPQHRPRRLRGEPRRELDDKFREERDGIVSAVEAALKAEQAKEAEREAKITQHTWLEGPAPSGGAGAR